MELTVCHAIGEGLGSLQRNSDSLKGIECAENGQNRAKFRAYITVGHVIAANDI